MQFAMVGLGRMGGDMVRRLMQAGHAAVVYDLDANVVAEYASLGATAATNLEDVCTRLSTPRLIWLMVPAGSAVDETIAQLIPMLSSGDIIVDGGNSFYKDSLRRARELSARGIEFIDAGTSGGIWGLQNGYCMMVGGSTQAVTHCEPIFRALAPADGYAHVGASGSGHYVKMVHNGIEYGMLQAYAEGYQILHASPDFSFDLHQIAGLWNHGSVVRSWLNELAEKAFSADAELAGIAGYVADSGEGRWTVQKRSISMYRRRSSRSRCWRGCHPRQSKSFCRQGNPCPAQQVRGPFGENPNEAGRPTSPGKSPPRREIPPRLKGGPDPCTVV